MSKTIVTLFLNQEKIHRDYPFVNTNHSEVKNAGAIALARAILSNPQMALVKPSVNWFLLKYLRKFRVQEVGGNLILHSHLPPLNSKAYSRFVNEHLLGASSGPSHAQIGVTNACPQRCEYCYNRSRTGKVMDLDTIVAAVRELKRLGVFWLGITGGEPLLNRNLPRVVETAGEECAVKLFTSGVELKKQNALDLKQAGLFSVSVSLDHWKEERHDQVRMYKGAFRTALNAISMFRSIPGLHVSVSAVLSPQMIKEGTVEEFLAFLRGLDIHEAWLSEAKPSIVAYQNEETVITEEQRSALFDLQDRYNKNGGMTVNYLGHFEDARHFGCTAGNKMVYVDAFGDVSPCVFIPLTFGNVHQQSLTTIYTAMRALFPTESRCFINKTYEVLRRHATGDTALGPEASRRVVDEVQFGPRAEFFARLHGTATRQ
jgi:MoaA/NifB/PqqE/SkfB family radical SAM enzyme